MDFTFALNTTIIRHKLTDIYLYYVAQVFLPPPYQMFITEGPYQTGLRDCDAILALIFLFFIRITSFWNIVGGMGASLCIPSFMRICELLPPKLHYPEILVLLSLLTEISLSSVQNG